MTLVPQNHLRKSNFKFFYSNWYCISYSKMKPFFPFLQKLDSSPFNKKWQKQKLVKLAFHRNHPHNWELAIDLLWVITLRRLGLTESKAVNSSPRDKSCQVCLRGTWQHIKNKNIGWLFLLIHRQKILNCLYARKFFTSFMTKGLNKGNIQEWGLAIVVSGSSRKIPVIK